MYTARIAKYTAYICLRVSWTIQNQIIFYLQFIISTCQSQAWAKKMQNKISLGHSASLATILHAFTVTLVLKALNLVKLISLQNQLQKKVLRAKDLWQLAQWSISFSSKIRQHLTYPECCLQYPGGFQTKEHFPDEGSWKKCIRWGSFNCIILPERQGKWRGR